MNVCFCKERALYRCHPLSTECLLIIWTMNSGTRYNCYNIVIEHACYLTIMKLLKMSALSSLVEEEFIRQNFKVFLFLVQFLRTSSCGCSLMPVGMQNTNYFFFSNKNMKNCWRNDFFFFNVFSKHKSWRLKCWPNIFHVSLHLKERHGKDKKSSIKSSKWNLRFNE